MIKPRYSFGGEILILILIAFYDFFKIKTGVERKKFQRRTTPTVSRRNSESLGGTEIFLANSNVERFFLGLDKKLECKCK